jgi:hypothetical protein
MNTIKMFFVMVIRTRLSAIGRTASERALRNSIVAAKGAL